MKAEIFIGLPEERKKDCIFKNSSCFIDARKVLEFISTKTKVSVNQIKSKSRKRNIVLARHAYVWCYRQILVKKGVTDSLKMKFSGKSIRNPYHSSTEVMSFINRDHSTGSNSVKAFENDLFTNKKLKKEAYEWLDELDKMFI